MNTKRTPAELAMTKARTALIINHPFFGALALRLRTEETNTVDTMATDGARLLYNPDWTLKITADERMGVIAHEVMHCACQHMTRRESRDPKRWNVAADYAINSIIEDAGLRLPSCRLREPQYDNQPAESIYNKLPQDKDGDGQGNDPGGCGGVMDPTGPDGKSLQPADASTISDGWKIATVQAAQAAKAQGKLPASIARILGDLTTSTVDWRAELRRFINLTAKDDYRMFPANRRHLPRGYVLPSMHSEQLQPIVVAIDTSGSIDADTLNSFASELNAICGECKISTLTVIYADAEINGDPETYTAQDLPIKLEPRGGGGTDFRPAIEWTSENQPDAACMVYLTDTYGDFGDAPEYPVLWVSTTHNPSVPFGEVVEM